EALDHFLYCGVVVLVDAVRADEAVDREHVDAVLAHEPDQRDNVLLIAFDVTGAPLLRYFDLDLALGDDDQAVADFGRRQPVLAHDRCDALVHGVAGVFEVDQDDAQWGGHERPQRTAAGHGQRLDNRQRALAGAAHRSRAGDLAAQQVPTVKPQPLRNVRLRGELVGLGGNDAVGGNLAADIE